jgi:hypothetical protein
VVQERSLPRRRQGLRHRVALSDGSRYESDRNGVNPVQGLGRRSGDRILLQSRFGPGNSWGCSAASRCAEHSVVHENGSESYGKGEKKTMVRKEESRVRTDHAPSPQTGEVETGVAEPGKW